MVGNNMVTKTISINDELFLKIIDITTESDMKFSQVIEKLCKLGLAYREILKIESSRKD
jgi:predicted CopG family antitoxin